LSMPRSASVGATGFFANPIDFFWCDWPPFASFPTLRSCSISSPKRDLSWHLGSNAETPTIRPG
jgi:hypothetical protein